ncbi:MAG: methyl-accepting chemotaxis protein [Velocimicrobium sp.]
MNQKLRNLNISQKLKFYFGIITGGFILAIIVALISLTVVTLNFKHYHDVSFKATTVQLNMQKKLEAAAKNILWACTTSEEALVSERIEAAKSELTELNNNFIILKQLWNSNSGILSDLEDVLDSNSKYEETMFILSTSGNDAGALKFYNSYYAESLVKASQLLEVIGNNIDTSVAKDFTTSTKLALLSLISTLILSICSVCIAIYSIKRLTITITPPIKEIERAAKAMAEGNLQVDITYESKDELGSLADSMRYTTQGINKIIGDIEYCLQTIGDGNFCFESNCSEDYIGDYVPIHKNMNHIADKLSFAISEIKNFASQVSYGAENLSDGAQCLAEGAAEQASAVEELVVSIGGITNQVVETATSVKEADKMAESVANEANMSSEHMKRMTDAMTRITETSSQIEAIIQSIEQIASQTNLLSLNAAIEAARVGEAGKGFAVVADEIRELANQSALAAMNTRKLIQSTVYEIQSGNEIVELTSVSLEQVLNAIEDMRSVIQKVTVLTTQQATAMKEIDSGIEQISAVVQNTSATAEESSATSEELAAQAGALDGLMTQFKTREREEAQI